MGALVRDPPGSSMSASALSSVVKDIRTVRIVIGAPLEVPDAAMLYAIR